METNDNRTSNQPIPSKKELGPTQTLRKLMYQNIRSYNNVLTVAHLSNMSFKELLANCHPSDRVRFETLYDETVRPVRSK